MASVGAVPTAKRPGPGLAISIVLIAVGIMVAVIGGIVTAVGVIHDVNDAATGITPFRTSQHLSSGTWEIFAAEDSSGLQPADVTVTGADGAQVLTSVSSGPSESFDKGGLSYTAAVQFTVASSGTYAIVVRGSPDTPVLLFRSFGDVIRHALLGLSFVGLGGLVGIVGVVMLIVGIVRRSRFTRGATPAFGGGYAQPIGAFPPGPPTRWPDQTQAPAPPAGLPVAGWYADPSQPDTQRWWDGTRWTDQTRTPA